VLDQVSHGRRHRNGIAGGNGLQLGSVGAGWHQPASA
jgi:hypothetical protein